MGHQFDLNDNDFSISKDASSFISQLYLAFI
jgi:hypothetical protein